MKNKRNQNPNSKIQTPNSHLPTLTTHHSGITLIALVVTVVVLLILAGVTITLMFGDNNIFDLAKEAGNKTNEAVKSEQSQIDELNKWLTENGYGSSNGGSEENPEIPTGPNGKPLVGSITKNNTENQKAEDKNGNPITIPAGFTVVANSPEGTDEAEKVVYSYKGDGTPAVQDGIVIEDSEGNQFVWVPVGTIKNKEGDTEHGEESTIILGRYEDFTATNKVYTPKQIAETQYKGTSVDANIDFTYQQNYNINSLHIELNTKQSGQNEVAKNLGDFITKTIANKGYYIARYEASGKEGGEVKSKANQAVWNSVNQATASSKSQTMYDNINFESDLINSYSWDTAIIFIQTYSKGNSNYANQTTKKEGESPFNTGTSGDRACNIHDMASNCREWSTENCTYMSGSHYPCVSRGGVFDLSITTTDERHYDYVGCNDYYYSFRSLLYCSTET